MNQPQAEQPKKKEVVKISLSELDTTLINLHNLFQGDQIIITLVLNLSKKDKTFIRTFKILDCFSAGTNADFKRPDYLG